MLAGSSLIRCLHLCKGRAMRHIGGSGPSHSRYGISAVVWGAAGRCILMRRSPMVVQCSTPSVQQGGGRWPDLTWLRPRISEQTRAFSPCIALPGVVVPASRRGLVGASSHLARTAGVVARSAPPPASTPSGADIAASDARGNGAGTWNHAANGAQCDARQHRQSRSGQRRPLVLHDERMPFAFGAALG